MRKVRIKLYECILIEISPVRRSFQFYILNEVRARLLKQILQSGFFRFFFAQNAMGCHLAYISWR